MSRDVDPEIPLPCCPHCGGDMPTVGVFNWASPPVMIVCVYCPHDECRKTIHMQAGPMMGAGDVQGSLIKH